MKKKILVSTLLLILIVGISTMVMADNYVITEMKSILNGMVLKMVLVGVAIIASIAGIVTLNLLKKKGRIKPALHKVLVPILVIVLIAFICYEGKLIWDYAGLKPAYDYLVQNEKIG